ncbi:MAG: uroporphyrinogen decarboxylase family protein [Promethearchaeia archaeon]
MPSKLKYIYVTNDLGYKGRTIIISPKMFRELFKPGITRFCDVVHKYGVRVIMHSCGYIMELIPDFIEMGIDALYPIERAAGNDIVEIKDITQLCKLEKITELFLNIE